jgi:outer membrane lipoprotein SlyB
MKSLHTLFFSFLFISAMVGGCAATNSPPATTTSSSVTYYGVIESIDKVGTSNDGIAGSGIGVGTVIGGVLGGVVGNQVGGGVGNTAATVAGAVGGAVIGGEIDKNRQVGDAYQIRVRLDNGSTQSVTQNSISDLRIGDKVRIQQNKVYRN